jgi:outer membrane receptor protein involved in Fe transport
MPTFRRSLLLLLIFSVFFPGFAYSQKRATLQGRVLDPDGRPVANARVSLFSGLVSIGQRTSDSEAHYSFEGLPTGTYVLIATVPGFSDRSAEVEMQDGKSVDLDLHLKITAVEEQVVVSASLDEALPSQIGSSVSVITQPDIENRDAESVLEVLRGIPGVEVSSTGRRGGATSVFIRGGNSNYNLVMIDGIQVNQFGGDFDFASIATDGVQRVEVSRGPESALFGSNAVAGVIAIVSETGDGPPHFSFLGEGGSFSTWRLATGGGGLTHGFSWAYNLSRLDSDGVVPNDYYRNQSSYLSLGYSRSPKRQFTFHFFGNANSVGSPGPYGSDPDHLFFGLDHTSRDKQNLFAYQANYSEQLTSQLKQFFSVSVAPDHSFFISSFGDSFLKNLRVTVNAHGEWNISSKDVFVYGFEYNHEQVQDTFITDANNTAFVLPRNIYGYFAENRWHPFRRWVLTTGLRIDDLRTGSLPPEFDPPIPGTRPFIPASSVAKVNPRVATSYILQEAPPDTALGATRIHGSFGTGIRAADGFAIAFTDNPKLKPEKNISGDAGVEQRLFADRAIFDVTYFYNRYKDQIVTLGGSLTNLSTFTSDNLANSRAQGLETSLRLRPLRSLDVSAEYTWLNTSILALDRSDTVLAPLAVGQPFLRRPRSSAGYNVTWHHGRLMLNTNAFIRGATLDVEPNDGTFACQLPDPSGNGKNLPCLFRNPGYVLVNAGFAYELPRGFEIHATINNLANQKYEDAFGFPALRLNFVTGIRFHFPAK